MEQEKAIDEAIAEVKEAKKKAKAKQKRRDSLKKDRPEADKEYLSRLIIGGIKRFSFVIAVAMYLST